jgi:hypothetical protein
MQQCVRCLASLDLVAPVACAAMNDRMVGEEDRDGMFGMVHPDGRMVCSGWWFGVFRMVGCSVWDGRMV